VTPYTYVIDDFLVRFSQLRAFADSAPFTHITNPADQVVYPHICNEIPDAFRSEVSYQLASVFGATPDIKYLFLRMSPKGVPVPHEAHTDLAMGQWSLMLYVSREFHCDGGTALVRHKDSGLSVHPRTDQELAIWQRDHNNRDAWETDLLVKMVANRAFIFPAYLMHRAEPIGGFGRTRQDARMVLTAFFNL
jgi:hypothetical protein